MSLSFNTLAQVQYIEKGTQAPFTGYLFTPEAELKNRKDLIQLDMFRQTVPLLEQNNTLLTKQVDLWRTQSDELSKQLIRQERSTFWQNLGYFALGAVLTTGLAFAVNQSTK
jgi:hypothetical protein